MAKQQKAPKGSLVEVSRRVGVSIATASRVLNQLEPSGRREDPREGPRGRRGARLLPERPRPRPRDPAQPDHRGDRQRHRRSLLRGDHPRDRGRGAKAGYLTIVCNADRRTELEEAQLRVLIDYHAEGASRAAATPTTSAARSSPAGRPRALPGHECTSLATRDFDCPRVLVDNRAAAYDLTDYVISLDHRRLAFVGGPAGLHTSRQLDRFRAAAERAGLRKRRPLRRRLHLRPGARRAADAAGDGPARCRGRRQRRDRDRR